jgi:hypothetical protein
MLRKIEVFLNVARYEELRGLETALNCLIVYTSVSQLL